MSKKDKKELTQENGVRPRKRKKKWLKFAIPAAIVVVVAIVVKNSMGNGTAAVPVYTSQVTKGDISTELNTSGTVKAENTKTFFAPASARVEGIEVSLGDIVKAGDVLLCFDEEAVAYAKRQSELENAINSADYNSNVHNNNEQRSKLEKAQAEIAECEAAIDNYEKYIDDLTNGITDMNALKKADLYAEIYSVEKQLNNYELAMQVPTEDMDFEDILRRKTDKQNELNKLQNELNMLSDYKTDYGWEDMLTQAKKDLADYETRLSEAKSGNCGRQ